MVLLRKMRANKCILSEVTMTEGGRGSVSFCGSGDQFVEGWHEHSYKLRVTLENVLHCFPVVQANMLIDFSCAGAIALC